MVEITYRCEGDYTIPNILANNELEEVLTKYGLLRKTFLKTNHAGIYTGKLLAGTLDVHCLEIQQVVEKMADSLLYQFMQAENVTEDLKSQNQMEWVRKMNSIKNMVDEIVLNEVVYRL